MIRFTSGDMFATPADLRVNTVNCVGIMGAGVAAAFKKRYPEMFRDYERECKAGRVQPGKLQIWKTLTNEWIVNFPTKRHWRENSRYEDIEAGLVAFREYLEKQGPIKVTLPALGCGHGGLDWQRVAPMIEKHLGSVPAEIAVFAPQDSHLHGIKDAESEFGKLHTITADDDAFPDALRGSQLKEIHSAGLGKELRRSDIAIVLSSKPSEREEKAALSVTKELAKPGVVLAITAGSTAANTVTAAALSQGATVSLWIAEGLARFRLPKEFKGAFQKGSLSVFTIARAEQGWNPRLAAQCIVATLASSFVRVIADPEPDWLPEIARSTVRSHPGTIFYLRYQQPGSDSQFTQLSAIPLGRRSLDGKPNVTPVFEALASNRESLRGLSLVPAKFVQPPIAIGKQLVQEFTSVSKSATVVFPKRLIEVDLPIKRISAHARREKSIRFGHISTLHLWWARRPLAACRAVTCAALWPDPVDENCPAEFRAVAAELLFKWARDNSARGSEESAPTWTTIRNHASAFALCNHPTTLRQALLDFIADFANWDNSTVPEYLETARALTAASHWALNLPVRDEPRSLGWPGLERWADQLRQLSLRAGEHPRPIVIDPFAGGGSIPLEALRIGADSFASDLNPIPVLLNKIVLEYIPKHGRRLADEVRKWGDWIKREAEIELRKYYPDDAEGATPIAYLWARTIRCEGPGCGAEVPLIRSLWLSKKANRPVAVQLIPNAKAKRVDFKIIEKLSAGWVNQDDNTENFLEPKFDGTVKRGSASCPCCGYTTPVNNVSEQLKLRRGGGDDARLFCVVTSKAGDEGRNYRLPSERDRDALSSAKAALSVRIAAHTGPLSLVPDEPLPPRGTLGFRVQRYGIATWGDAFSKRQQLTLVTLIDLVDRAANKIATESDPTLVEPVQTVLGMAVSRFTDIFNTLCRWEVTKTQVRNLFGRQAVPMIWDFAETNALADAAGNYQVTLGTMIRVLDANVFATEPGQVVQASATKQTLPDDSAAAVVTDPPYYDAVPYADLSDFFYVWLKRSLPPSVRSSFLDSLTPKTDECIVDVVKGKDRAYFERSMQQAMAESRRILAPNGVGVVVFAHKSTAGWEAQLQAMCDAGWIMTGSWPIDTELGNRLRAQDSAALASSIHLVCRPRELQNGALRTDEVGDWRDILAELPRRIHEWMPRLASEGVVGADAIFACLGPALEIFSRYSRVEKASGEPVTLREYLEHIWAAVSKEALSSLITGSDLSTLEADARITAMWLWTLNSGASATDGGDDADSEDSADDEEGGGKASASAKGGFGLEYDAARKIAQGLGASLEDMKAVVEVKGDQARLLPVAERTAYLFGKDQASTPDQTGREKKKKAAQLDLFAELAGAEAAETEAVWEEKTVSKPGVTVLDRVHQAMILFATGRGDALKRFLVEDGIGQEANFWKLAQALSALYPTGSQEKRWVDGVLARKKGLGL